MSQRKRPATENSVTSRRMFCQRAAGAAAAAVLGPFFVRASDKSGSRDPVIGPEGFRYRVRHDGLERPEWLRWQETHGVAVDAEALVVADRANARLQYFSASGESLGFVEGLLFPADVDLRGEVLLVPDLHARVTLLDGQNRVIAHLGDDPAWRERVLDGMQMRRHPDRWEAGKFVHPHDACFDHDGNIWVVEWVPTGRVSYLEHVG